MPNYKVLLPTPVSILNNYLAGGFRSGTMIELKGEPRSGKSTLAYQSAKMLLNSHPDATIIIEDIENSIDELRLEYVFDLVIDNKKIIRRKPAHMEQTFSEIESDLIEKNKNGDTSPVLYIIDSIDIMTMSANIGDSNMFAGGQNLRQRYLKDALRRIMAQLNDSIPVWIMMINQVYLVDRYTGKMDSGGGTALKHDIHYSVMHSLKKTLKDDAGNVVYTLSYLSMDKSKFNPTFFKVPVYIDVKNGGWINDKVSVETFGMEQELIKSKGGYYWIPRFDGDDCEEAPNFQGWDKLVKGYADNYFADPNIAEILSHIKSPQVPPDLVGKCLASPEGSVNTNSFEFDNQDNSDESTNTEVKAEANTENNNTSEVNTDNNDSTESEVESVSVNSDLVIKSHLKQLQQEILEQGQVIYNDPSIFDLPEDQIPKWYLTTNLWESKRGRLHYWEFKNKPYWYICRTENDDFEPQKKLRWEALVQLPETVDYIVKVHRKQFRETYPLMDFVYKRLIADGVLDENGDLKPSSTTETEE